MLQIKPGVRVHGLKPEILLALQIATEIYQKHGFDCVLTSAIDGKHSRGSRHYTGSAIDLRTRHLPDPGTIADEIKTALGADYDVVLEGMGTPNQHIHIEFDPKDAYA